MLENNFSRKDEVLDYICLNFFFFFHVAIDC